MKKRIFWTICTITTMILIFIFSSQNSSESSQTSGFVFALLQMISHINISEHFIRKAAHFSIFALLGFNSYQMFKTYPLSKKRIFFFSLLFCFLYACSDEFHQSFSPGRSSQFSDVLIDASGSLTAITLSHFIKSKML